MARQIDGVRWCVSEHAITRFLERVADIGAHAALQTIVAGIQRGRRIDEEIRANVDGLRFRLRCEESRNGNAMVVTTALPYDPIAKQRRPTPGINHQRRDRLGRMLKRRRLDADDARTWSDL